MKDGKLLYVSAIVYCDCGFSYNESTSSTAAAFAKNCYKAVAWNIAPSGGNIFETFLTK
jgi:hypothetical protein